MENEILDYFGKEEYYKGKIIAVKYFYFESQAILYAARLREHGIRAFVSNTNAITAFPMGDGGIGLHIRESDLDQSLSIIRKLDQNNLEEPQNVSFHEADLEDIAYEKALTEQKQKIDPLIILFVIIISLVIYRALMRSQGFLFWGDSF